MNWEPRADSPYGPAGSPSAACISGVATIRVSISPERTRPSSSSSRGASPCSRARDGCRRPSARAYPHHMAAERRVPAGILAAMATAPIVLDIGLVLLLAAALGWVARRLGLPSVVGYLAAGLAVSPFTPGYVADHEQIELLADVGVVLLLFEVGIEVDLGRLRREQRGLLWAAPAQLAITWAVSTAVLLAFGLQPLGGILVGLAVAMSSSVVIVNITRSRRRTTDRPTEQALLGWSVLQDVAGVAAAAIVFALSGIGGRPLPVALGGLALFVGLAVVARAAPAGRPPPPAQRARPVPDRVRGLGARGRGAGRGRVRRPAGARGVRRRPRDLGPPRDGRGPAPAAAVPRRVRGPVLRRRRVPARPVRPARRAAAGGAPRRARGRRQGGRRVGARAAREARRPAAPAGRGPGSARRVRVRAGGHRRRGRGARGARVHRGAVRDRRHDRRVGRARPDASGRRRRPRRPRRPAPSRRRSCPRGR